MSKIYFTILGYLLWLMGRNIKKHKETRKATKYGKLFMTIYYM